MVLTLFLEDISSFREHADIHAAVGLVLVVVVPQFEIEAPADFMIEVLKENMGRFS